MKIKSQINTESMSIIKSFLEKLDIEEYHKYCQKETGKWEWECYDVDYTIKFAAFKGYIFSKKDAQNFYYENKKDFVFPPRFYNFYPEAHAAMHKSGVFWTFEKMDMNLP